VGVEPFACLCTHLLPARTFQHDLQQGQKIVHPSSSHFLKALMEAAHAQKDLQSISERLDDTIGLSCMAAYFVYCV